MNDPSIQENLDKELARLRKIESAAKKFLSNHGDAAREWCSTCDEEGLMCCDQLEEAIEEK